VGNEQGKPLLRIISSKPKPHEYESSATIYGYICMPQMQ
jgi:hypothetical protein